MTTPPSLEQQLAHLSTAQLRRLLVEHLTKQKLGLYWEHDAIERDNKLNDSVVLPRLDPNVSLASEEGGYRNLVIEGDNFDVSLRQTCMN